MDTSILIARLLAVVYLTVGIGMLFNHEYYQKMLKKILKDPTVFYFGGVMALVAGVLMVTFHNIWQWNWLGLITLFGWIAVLKGVMLLVLPEHTTRWRMDLLAKNLKTWAIVVLFLGVVFGYFGFVI